MKKLIVSAILLISMVLLVSSCGTEEVDWDDFFNEYYSECISLCHKCADWKASCGDTHYNITECAEKNWYNGTRNLDCDFYIEKVDAWLTDGVCHPNENWCFTN